MKRKTELDEIVTTVGPVTIRRLRGDNIIMGIHQDREDGCATPLSTAECREVTAAITTIADLCPGYQVAHTGKLFREELIERASAVSGLTYAPNHHTGLGAWIAERCHVCEVTAGRYLVGESLPLPRIARALSEVLGWPYEEMVSCIIASAVDRDTRAVLKRYHLKENTNAQEK